MSDPAGPERYDYIVVGGGTAGCVLAARLSAHPGNRVLLVEAGQDTPPDAMPADILDPYPLSYANPAYRWPLKGHAQLAESSGATPLLHARVMGGGSSVMGMVMLRGTPADYDEWAAMGASGWSWDAVLPWFRTLEHDLDFAGPLHGQTGPTEIRRHDPAGWPPVARAAQAYFADRGLPLIADMNGDFGDGLGSLPIAGTVRRRTSAATAYLTARVRARANLVIMANATVRALVWEGERVAGVRVATPSGPRDHLATETLLTMGALLTPHFLMAQGIGPPEDLTANGVAVRAARHGVGRNLQNHAALSVSAHIRRAGLQRRPERNHNNAMLRYSSAQPGCPPSDMMLAIGSRAAWHAIAARVAHFAPIVMAPASRGRVRLRNGSDAPLIEYDLLGDPADARRLAASVDLIAAFVADLQRRGFIGSPVPISRASTAARFGRRTHANRIATAAIGALMDMAPVVGDSFVAKLGRQGMGWADLIADPAARDAFVRTNVTPLAHHAGTCRMGAADDPGAVVDPDGRVYGVPGLRVADASIMPTVPRGNTNLPVLMIAEKLADAILRGARRPSRIPS